MGRPGFLFLVAGFCMAGLSSGFAGDLSALEKEVMDTERAFAQTMADRDFDAFREFLSDEAVFFARGEPTRGSDAIADRWEGFYEGEEAPFSWKPGIVAVLESGNLALSSGPVFNSSGEQFGVFNSIWRRNDDGQWKVIFDKGGQYCPPVDAGE